MSSNSTIPNPSSPKELKALKEAATQQLEKLNRDILKPPPGVDLAALAIARSQAAAKVRELNERLARIKP